MPRDIVQVQMDKVTKEITERITGNLNLGSFAPCRELKMRCCSISVKPANINPRNGNNCLGSDAHVLVDSTWMLIDLFDVPNTCIARRLPALLHSLKHHLKLVTLTRSLAEASSSDGQCILQFVCRINFSDPETTSSQEPGISKLVHCQSLRRIDGHQKIGWSSQCWWEEGLVGFSSNCQNMCWAPCTISAICSAAIASIQM